METVINAQERKYAFAKFLFLFSITVAIIIAAVYFDTLIPNNENEMLRKRIANLEKQIYTQEQCVVAMEEVKSLIDSSTKSGKLDALMDFEIAKKLNALGSVHFQDSISNSGLNKKIFLVLNDYNKMNQALLLNSKTAIQEVEKLKTELENHKQHLEIVKLDTEFWKNKASLCH
jgi:hypothetical protein